MQALGIHHLSAIETDPVAFVAMAAQAGCQTISVFTRAPGERSGFPLVDQHNKAAMAAALRDHGIAMGGIEAFMLTPRSEPQSFLGALELGAELGAQRAGVLLYDGDESRVIDNVSALCDMASGLQLKVGIEFMPLAPGWKTLAAMNALIEKIAHPNLAVAIDVLHLVRSGGSPEEVAALAPGQVAYAQLCDGADLTVTEDYAEEAAGNRLAPGDGVFPLRAFLRSLPTGTPLELEVPQRGNQAPLERVRHAVSATRKLIVN